MRGRGVGWRGCGRGNRLGRGALGGGSRGFGRLRRFGCDGRGRLGRGLTDGRRRGFDVRDGRPEADLLRFEAGGGCWENPEFAKGCITGCSRALERLRAREASLPGECAP